jgi:hypothetical protein
MKQIVLIALVLIACQSALADEWCATPTPQSDPLLDRNTGYPYPHEMESAAIRIYVHRLFRMDGSGGISEAQVDQQLQYLYDGFAPHSIQFVLAGSYTHNVPFYDATLSFIQYMVPFATTVEHTDGIDIFLTDPNHGFNGADAFQIPSTKLVCSGDRMQNEVIVHETGHCLGLYHTFEDQFGAETPDGSNCEVAGDLVCDTAACPENLYDTVPETCLLSVVFQNAYPDYFPDPHNYMTFAPPHCRDNFTPEQEDRMFAFLEEIPILQAILVETAAVSYQVPENGQSQTPAEITGLDYPGTPYSAVQWNYRGIEGGDKDIFISVSNEDSKLYVRASVGADGYPFFASVPNSEFLGGDPQAGLRGLAVADLGDGNRAELFAAAESHPRLYRFNGLKIVNEAVGLGLEARANNSIAASWGFVDSGNRFPDLLVSRAQNFVEVPLCYSDPGLAGTGTVLLENVPGSGAEGRAFAPTPTAGLPNFLGSTNSAWCDYDEDRDMDLFIGSLYDTGSGASRLLRNDGGVFVDVTNQLQTTSLEMVTACGWADMNGDTTMDLVVTRRFDQVAIFFNDGNGSFDDGNGGAGPFEIGASEGHSGFVLYDFDLDRDMDLLALSSSDTRSVQLLENISMFSPQFLDVTSAVGLDVNGYSHGAISADFGNAPGDSPLPDLYFGRPSSSGTFYYKGQVAAGAGNHFVSVRLVSDADSDNSTGLGASVVVTAGMDNLVQVVDGGSMRGGQKSRDLVFGLGDYTGPLTASVFWPSGTEQDEVPLTIDELNVISLADITVDDSSVVGKYIVHAGGPVDWEFTWDTNIMGDPAYDEVIFDIGNISTQCQPDLSLVSLAASGDVTLTTSTKAGGGFTHVMTWKDRPCVPNCIIPFWVKSGHNQKTDQSDTAKNLRVRICVGN